MAITYSGITPTLKIDTSDLQNTEKLSKKGNKLVKNRNGVCAAMVVDWIEKSMGEPGGVTGGVTDKSQLKSGLALSLDFAKWFPPFVKGEYPDLRDEVILRKITG